jgi:hypothetical protein
VRNPGDRSSLDAGGAIYEFIGDLAFSERNSAIPGSLATASAGADALKQ